MFSIIAFVVGLVFGVIVRNRMDGTKFLEYFGTPGRENKLDLDWTGRQFFLLFSKPASERWYEARAHLYRGVFISLLAAFGLIYIVRLEFNTSEDDRVSYTIFITHGFQSRATMKEKLPKWIEEHKHKARDAQWFYQMFISGHNVVCDFMTP